VVDDPPAHAAVVILVLNAHAPARILDSPRDDAVVVMAFVAIPVDDFPAWSGLTLEACRLRSRIPLLPKFPWGTPIRRTPIRRRRMPLRKASPPTSVAHTTQPGWEVQSAKCKRWISHKRRPGQAPYLNICNSLVTGS